jgi:acetyltransferase AlgX (SGNH hydrolase-like protein)
MSTEDTQSGDAIAQRPGAMRRWRLAPLATLCLCIVAAAVVGAVHGGPASSEIPASAPTPAGDGSDPASGSAPARTGKVDKACAPRWSSGVTREPWVGSARAASEKVFQKQIKKENPAYVRGKDGWLFFTDYQAENFSQALGRVTQSTKQREAWAKFLAESAQSVEEAGGEYHVVVAPANWDVYPRKLPTWAQELRGTTSLDRLMKAHPELPWIDPRLALRKAGAKNATYEAHDSHWTPYGGYVAWQAITRCLRTLDASRAVDAPPITGVDIVENSNEFAANGVPDGKPRRTVPVYADPHPEVVTTHLPDGAALPTAPDFVTDAVFAPLQTRTAAAQAPDLTLLTLRDSTGNALSPLWSWSFGTTVQYAHGIGMEASSPSVAKLAQTYQPDIVLFVITERFLSEPPPKK